jgi:hypothetical protein
LTPEHRRSHGMLYDGLGCGRIEVDRLRVSLAGLPLPRAADGRIVLGSDRVQQRPVPPRPNQSKRR